MRSAFLRIGIALLSFGATTGVPAQQPSGTSAQSGAAALLNLTHVQMRDDLVFLRDVWKPQDKSFSSERTQEFERLIGDTLAHVDRLDPVSFWMAASRAVASSGNGHTNIGDVPFPGLPFEAWWFKDGLYIVQAPPDHADLLGARIDRIGSKSAEQALAVVAPYISGNNDRVRNLSPDYLRVPALLHRLGLAKSDTQAQLTVQQRSGAKRKVTLEVLQTGDPPLAAGDNWSVLVPTETTRSGRWPHVLDAVPELPDVYRKPVDVATHWIGDGHRILYLRSNQVVGLDGNPNSLELKLIQLLFSEIVPNRPQAVIVDLRLNSGGNFLNTVLFSQALPKVLAPGGKVLVLVGTSTFSAAIVTAALLRESGGADVLFLGTNMGDNDRFYAEGARVPLPNSKLGIRVSPGFHDWSDGCHDVDRCFWPVAIWGPQPETKLSLRPDYPIDPTFAEYASGRDPVMEKALELARDVNTKRGE